MDRGLFRGVAAMNVAERRLDVIADNLANVSTTAFKRRTTFTEALHDAGYHNKDARLRTGTKTDWAQGELRQTGRPFDLALRGGGFFVVETANGQAYTRNGVFQVDNGGTLVTEDGNPLAWKSRGGTIDPTGEPVTIEKDGRVKQGIRELGMLEIVDFADKSRLGQDSDGNWTAPVGLRRATPTASVHQGHLEQSNASATDEMIELITLQRQYELSSSTLKQIDRSYQRLFQRR
jgi:flagellar basal-body rod protein FlgF